MTLSLPAHGEENWDVKLNAALTQLDAADTTETAARIAADAAKADLVAGTVPDGQIHSSIARDTEVTAAVAAEAAARATAISTAVSNLVNGAPGILDTLGEIATQLAADENAASALATTVAGKQPLDPDLTAIAAIDSTVAGALVTDGTGWFRKTYAQLKTALGLGNVDNTADTAKPISTATQTALDLKAPLASPAFTGTPTKAGSALLSAADASGAYVSQTAAAAAFASKFIGGKQRREVFQAAPAVDTPVVAPVVTATNITSPRQFPSITTAGVIKYTDEFFTYSCAGGRVQHSASFPDTGYIRFTSLTNGTVPFAPYAVSFDLLDSICELRFKLLAGAWKITVNGRAVNLSTLIELTGGPTGGTFTITIGGQTTAGLAHNATVAAVQAAVQGLTSVGAGNAVLGGAQTGTNGVVGSRYLITLLGTASGQAITVTSSLTGGTSPAIDLTLSPVVAVSQTSGTGYQLLTFPTNDARRIKFEAVGLPWGGVNTSATGTVTPASLASPRPRVICIGDSYTEGSNNQEGVLLNWARYLSELTGWDDVWSSGSGGTGWMNPGSIGGRVKARDRLANDVIPYSPDMVIYMMGHNDLTYLASDITTEVTLSLQQVAAALPNCIQVVLGPILSNGLDTGTLGNAITTRDAIKAGVTAAGLSNAYFVDPMEMPLSTTPISTTLASTINAAGTSASLAVAMPVGAWIDFQGTERRRVTAVSGVGPYPHTLNKGVSAQHLSGTAVTQVGPGLMSGSGNVGAPQLDGNADIITGTDATHPSRRGQKAIGYWVDAALTRLVLPSA